MTQLADGYVGHANATDAGSDYNAAALVAKDMLGRVQTATLVQVRAVTNAGGLSAVGMVDVQPMVHQVDGAGNPTPHGTIHGLPYFRLQGGANAIILDPQVGDIGIAVFANRDLSTVKATKKPGNPGSRRRNAMSDGLYIGGVLNGQPTQFVQFVGMDINITALASVTITGPANVILATPSVRTTGNLSVGTGASGSFSTPTGQTVTVHDGIVVNID